MTPIHAVSSEHRKRSWLDRYRVDNVPVALRPIYLALTEALGAGLATYFLLVRKTSRIEFTGDETYVTGRVRAIECVWHENVMVHAALGLDWRGHIWINHPSWYMRPIHVAGRWLGIRRMILGSTGHDGRQAADELVETLRRGHGTAMYPDGPQGPRRKLKSGVLHVAMQSGVPIVAIDPRPSRSFRLPTWDEKIVPLPFGTIRVAISAPISPHPDRLEETTRRLAAALGAGAALSSPA